MLDVSVNANHRTTRLLWVSDVRSARITTGSVIAVFSRKLIHAREARTDRLVLLLYSITFFITINILLYDRW